MFLIYLFSVQMFWGRSSSILKIFPYSGPAINRTSVKGGPKSKPHILPILRMCRWKHFENRSIFGEDVDKSIMAYFFGPPCIYLTDVCATFPK